MGDESETACRKPQIGDALQLQRVLVEAPPTLRFCKLKVWDALSDT